MPESYGVYRYVLAVVSLCSLTTITGINKTLGGYVAKGFHGTVAKTTILSLKTGLSGVLFLAIYSSYSFFIGQKIMQSYLLILATVCFLPYTIFSRYQSILAGLENFKLIFFYFFVQKISLFILTVITLYVLKKGILVFGYSQILFTSLFFIFCYKRSIDLLRNKTIDPGFIKHSTTISIISLGSQIIAPGIQLFLNFSLGTGALALYVIGNRIPIQIANVVKPIMHPISIRLAKKTKLSYNKAVIKSIPLTLILGTILYGFLYLGIEIFGPYIVDDSYIIALDYAKDLGLFIILSPTFSLLNSNVIFEKNNRAFSYSLFTNQAVTITGYFLFLKNHGIISIAYTNFVALAIQIIIMVVFLIRDITSKSR